MKKLFSIALLMLTLVFMLASCNMLTKHTVRFDLDGGVAGEGYAESVEIGDGKTLTLTTPTREGYSFLGWYAGENKVTEETPITSDLNLKAKWEIKSFKVSFVDYYGNTVSTQTVNFGESATAPAVDGIINNQRFDSWSADFSKVVEDMTVNALYVDNTYTITYNLGDKGDSFTESCFYSELPKIPAAPEVDGYVFTGWFLDEELTERFFFDYKLDRDITLYAKFYDTSLGEYIVISNVEQFKAIKDAPTQKYLLACDINCKGEQLPYIDVFQGELDGNGYKIFNFIISEESLYAGLIRTIAGTGSVKNLNICDYTYTVTCSHPTQSAFYGIIAALNYGIIDNCHVGEGEINVTASATYEVAIEVGGIAGRNGNSGNYIGYIKNCTNRATINADITHLGDNSVPISVGGITGRNYEPSSEIINCTNYGDVSLKTTVGATGIKQLAVGGICGYNGVKIDNCVNNANISTTVELIGFSGYYNTSTGGIAGINYGNINNSHSNGNIIKTEIDNYNYNYVTIDYIGGFVGRNFGIIYNCYSTGDVSAMPSLELYAGGFIGSNIQKSGYTSTITKCFSTGSVEIIDNVADSTSVIYVGHFAGNNDVNIKDCYYLDSVVLTYKNVAGETETLENIEATCTVSEAKSFEELVSVDFIENTLYFDRMIWLVVEGQLPTLR